MTHGGLFNGIGGFQLAAEWMGWENIFSCEIDEFCNKVTKHHFPNCVQHGDIKTTDFSIYRGKTDIVTGGFPCQPFSMAGKRKGTEDNRHLWPEMLRAVREIQPRWVVGENVPGLINWSKGLVFQQVQADLEAEGFEVFPPCILPACAANAPHRRDRIWIIARNASESFGKRCNNGSDNWQERHIQTNERIAEENKSERNRRKCGTCEIDAIAPNSNGNNERLLCGQESKLRQATQSVNSNISSERIITNPERVRQSRQGEFQQPIDSETNSEGQANWINRSHEINDWREWPTQSPVCGRDDGVPNRVDRIKGLGNAIVPQIAYEIFKTIEQFEINANK